MSKTRIVFMGTPDFAVPCLSTLVNDGHDVCMVISQPDRPKGRGQKLQPSPVKQAACELNIPVLTPERIKDAAFIECLKDIKPDMIIVVAFGQFLPKELLELPRYGCINVHASLLPHYRGAAPIHWAVINGETKTGITTMFMDVGMDTGDMILKSETEIGSATTTGELHDTLKELGAQVLSETVRRILDGTAPRIAQEHAAATYAPMLSRGIEKIDWRNSAGDIHNLVRGLNPWPGAYCNYQGKGLKIWKTQVLEAGVGQEPGHILLQKGTVIAATGSGAIELLEVQPENKRRMSAAEFLRGYGSVEGTAVLE